MTVFDSRPWYMNYEFVVRTSDNVELLLSISFFWSLENIAFIFGTPMTLEIYVTMQGRIISSLKSNIETIYGEFQLWFARNHFGIKRSLL